MDGSRIDWTRLKGVAYEDKIEKQDEGNFDLNKLKRHAVFEKLVLDFMQEKTPKKKWESTKNTRDFNHDGYMILACFIDGDHEWWFEAKYSYGKNKEKFARYRLDPTIVSALASKRKVDNIFFIHNGFFLPQARMDLRAALSNSARKTNVNFYDRNIIEFWLLKNRNFLEFYFNYTLEEINNLLKSSDDIVHCTDVQIFEENNFLYSKPIYDLHYNQIYNSKFIISSSQPINITITSVKNIDILNPLNLYIDGDKEVSFKFSITKNWKSSKSRVFQAVYNDKKYDIYSEQKICMTDVRVEHELVIQSQIKAIEFLKANYAKSDPMIFLMYGESGVGKTFAMGKALGSLSILSYKVSFNDNIIDNYKKIANMLAFMLLPFINPEDILSYRPTSSLQCSDSILNLFLLFDILNDTNYSMNEKYDKLSVFVTSFECNFQHSCGNNIIILLDDFQKLDNCAQKFINNILKRAISSRTSYKFVVIARDNIVSENINIFNNLTIYKFQIGLTTEDVVYNIKNIFNSSWQISSSVVLAKTIKNVYSLLSFLHQVKQQEEDIRNNSDLLKEIVKFKIEELEINRIFNFLTNEYPEAATLLNEIYFSLDSVKLTNKNKKHIAQLIRLNLIREDLDKYIPIHDFYRSIYVKYHTREDWVPKNIGEEKLRTLLFGDKSSKIRVAEQIINNQNNNFTETVFVLEYFFMNDDSILRNDLSTELYYHLKYAFTYAAMVNMPYFDENEKFLKLYNELNSRSFDGVRELKIRIIYELMNGNYTSSEKLNHYYGLFKNELNALPLYEYNPRIKDLELWAEHLLVYSELNAGTININRFYNTRNELRAILSKAEYSRRYAIHLIIHDYQTAKKLNDEAIKFYIDGNCNHHKTLSLIEYEKSIFNYIDNYSIENLRSIEVASKSMVKNFPTFYQHCTMGIALFYYAKKDIILGDKNFATTIFEQQTDKRCNDRYYYHVLAMRCLCCGEYEDAIQQLRKALSMSTDEIYYDYILEHNIQVLKSNQFSFNQIKVFTKQDIIKDEIYYIDPRIFLK
ncbi:MAG: hypothetical protein R3Y65_09210 [Bacillota bacterium]